MNAQKILGIGVAVALAAGLSGCGGRGAIGELGELKRLARSCPANSKLGAYVAWDARHTLRGRRITAARLESVRTTAAKVAVCAGHLRVVAFGPTAASTARLYDDDLEPAGATLNARLLRVPALTDQVERTVRSKLPAVLKDVSGQSADPLSQFVLAAQFRRQLGDGYALHVVLLTSGFTSTIGENQTSFEASAATSEAENVDVPDLTDADVVVAGLGKVGKGRPTPTPIVEALRAFYRHLCGRTKAASCLAITDLAPLGG